jgi:hypothetical protein
MYNMGFAESVVQMVNDIRENMNRFLAELYGLTRGDVSVMVSMYDIGETLGLDRDDCMHTAEELIGTGLVEIKTLNGGVSITADGVAEAHEMGIAVDKQAPPALSPGDTPVIDEAGRSAVEHVADELKSQMGEKGLSFDQLAELMADLKSIDAQLSSPHPKKAIVRECFQSIKDLLKTAGDADASSKVEALLGA